MNFKKKPQNIMGFGGGWNIQVNVSAKNIYKITAFVNEFACNIFSVYYKGGGGLEGGKFTPLGHCFP